ncbi:uncharacterized BrkB/YihY/UPF0761 family membrane protein [Rhodoblastus acidophilus]|nr:uncharacterized BrkB/YihY/UPF0761 family membrane protein [Rhodoblastus acidophilus]MCW2332010.1 uncharacterized BrkB/YihY/UPF0761 family membrane protein [Rhodoblastus acidophilus]
MAVFFGMLGVTLFGLFLTPVFYVLVRSLEARLSSSQSREIVAEHGAPAE